SGRAPPMPAGGRGACAWPPKQTAGNEVDVAPTSVRQQADAEAAWHAGGRVSAALRQKHPAFIPSVPSTGVPGCEWIYARVGARLPSSFLDDMSDTRLPMPTYSSIHCSCALVAVGLFALSACSSSGDTGGGGGMTSHTTGTGGGATTSSTSSSGTATTSSGMT